MKSEIASMLSQFISSKILKTVHLLVLDYYYSRCLASRRFEEFIIALYFFVLMCPHSFTMEFGFYFLPGL